MIFIAHLNRQNTQDTFQGFLTLYMQNMKNECYIDNGDITCERSNQLWPK